jgi:hypothetical protein
MEQKALSHHKQKKQLFSGELDARRGLPTPVTIDKIKYSIIPRKLFRKYIITSAVEWN